MCTVQSIKDAIRENCQSQHDMESTDIDQVLQALPFSEHDSPFSQPPKHMTFIFRSEAVQKKLNLLIEKRKETLTTGEG